MSTKHSLPQELLLLRQFDQDLKEAYSEGFELLENPGSAMLRSYSVNETFLASLIEFANASASGSTYAFWIANDKNLSTAPIVLFGDEGGYHIVAKNIRELLAILTFDAEPMVDWERVFYYKGKAYVESPLKNKFRDWLLSTFQIKAVDDPGAIVKNAQTSHSEEFQTWMKQYTN